MKKVAYDTISRRDRKTRHLAAAAFLRSLVDEDEIVEVVASHYLDAYRAAPDDEDAGTISDEALEMLVRGERASCVTRPPTRRRNAALRAGDRADRRPDRPRRAPRTRGHHGRAGRVERWRQSTSSRRSSSSSRRERHTRALASRPGSPSVMWDRGRLERPSRDGSRRSRCSHGGAGRGPRGARRAARRFMFFPEIPSARRSGSRRRSTSRRRSPCPEVLSQALNTKAMILLARAAEEGMALMRHGPRRRARARQAVRRSARLQQPRGPDPERGPLRRGRRGTSMKG